MRQRNQIYQYIWDGDQWLDLLQIPKLARFLKRLKMTGLVLAKKSAFPCRTGRLQWARVRHRADPRLISRQAVALNAKSGASHLEDLDGALRLFKRLAELDFV